MKPKPKKQPKLKKQTKPTKRTAGASQATMARYLDLSQQRISQFVAGGTFPILAGSKLDRDACRLAYIRWLRDETRKSSAAEAAKRVQNARAAMIELQTAKERGKLIELEEVEASVAEIISSFCLELSGVAAASTRDVAQREVIQANLNGAIEWCKARLGGLCSDAAAGRPLTQDGGDDD
jgi:hypothetical protein